MLSPEQLKIVEAEKETVKGIVSEIRAILDDLMIKGIKNFDGSDIETLNKIVAKNRDVGLINFASMLNKIATIASERQEEEYVDAFTCAQQIETYLKMLDREINAVNIDVEKHPFKE